MEGETGLDGRAWDSVGDWGFGESAWDSVCDWVVEKKWRKLETEERRLEGDGEEKEGAWCCEMEGGER